MLQFTLLDGSIKGTGLQLPERGKVTTFTAIEAAEAVGDIKFLTKAQIQKIAKSGEMDGRKKFDKSWVKDQKTHGSCNGFAGAAVLTKARVLNGQPRVDLSGAYLYSLINGGMDRGSQLEDGMNKMAGGIATAETVPWNAIYPSQYDREKAREEASRFRGVLVYAIESEEGYWNALALGYMVVTAVHAGSRFMQVDRASGVAGVDYGPGNHAVHCDGLTWVGELAGTGENSWNVTYGVNGRMNLLSAHYQQPSKYHLSYAVLDVSEDPKDSSELPKAESASTVEAE